MMTVFTGLCNISRFCFFDLPSSPGTSGEWKPAGGTAAVPAAGDGTSQPVCAGTHACLLQCYYTHTAE